MIILRLLMGSDNITYVVSGDKGLQCAVIDPIIADEIVKAVDKAGLGKISSIINTHGHPDHTSGNTTLAELTGARILAHDPDRGHIPGNPEAVADGDEIKIEGPGISVLHTPGHTAGGICLYVKPDGEAGHLFSGDTVFLSGCGNPRFGGDPVTLYESFESRIFKLPPDTKLHPGHDYAANNLNFALSVEPDNSATKRKLDETKNMNASGEIPASTLAQEREYNPFFRLDSDGIRKTLAEKFSRDFDDDKSVFLALRELRNQW